jgi:hypothetical protein
MIHAKEVGMNFRTAILMIVLASATVGGTIRSAYALPRGCSALLDKINMDYDEAQYWNVLAAADANAQAWDDYQYAIYWVSYWNKQAVTDSKAANRLRCG